jgi:hypothetical protein
MIHIPKPMAKGPSDKPHRKRFKEGTRAGVWFRTARKNRKQHIKEKNDQKAPHKHQAAALWTALKPTSDIDVTYYDMNRYD